MNSTSQTVDTKKSWILVVQQSQKGNDKETFYGSIHRIVRQSKQKMVSSFRS